MFESITRHLRESVFWPWFFRFIQLVAASLFICWWRWYVPLPGYAIGVLAVLAAVMSLHIEAKMQWWEKSVWMLLMGAFLVLEFKAIREDRRMQDEAHNADLAKQSKANQDTITAILDSRNAQMAQNQIQFEQTLQKMSGLAANGQRAINLMTGGDSNLYFSCGDIIGGPTELEIGGIPKGVMVDACFPVFSGKFPLQVHVSMFGPAPVRRWEKEYGTIYPQEYGKSYEGFYLMFFPTESKSLFHVFIVASNGVYNQIFIVKKFGDKWLWGSRFFKYEGTKAELVKKFGAPGFPTELLDINVDWDKL